MHGPVIQDVRCAVVRCPLEQPIAFGDWTIRHREFATVGIRAESGATGFAYCLTRDGPVKAIVDHTVASMYVGRDSAEPETNFFRALWSNHSTHAAGVGMRALSLVDIAAWDLASKGEGKSLTAFLGGEPATLPVTAIVGYPPSLSPEATRTQVKSLWDSGWRRFKLPIAPEISNTIARLEAARSAAPDGWIGVDANMTFRTPEQVIDFSKAVAHLNLGWIEDILPPGNAAMVRASRDGAAAPIAVGDEQGGAYFPEALLGCDAANVIRVDATTDGGITMLRRLLPSLLDQRVEFAPHMFAHTHARLLNGLGLSASIEWGIGGTGVHPMDDAIEQPQVEEGLMHPLSQDPGLGKLLDGAWIQQMEVEDPDHLFDWI